MLHCTKLTEHTALLKTLPHSLYKQADIKEPPKLFLALSCSSVREDIHLIILKGCNISLCYPFIVMYPTLQWYIKQIQNNCAFPLHRSFLLWAKRQCFFTCIIDVRPTRTFYYRGSCSFTARHKITWAINRINVMLHCRNKGKKNMLKYL